MSLKEYFKKHPIGFAALYMVFYFTSFILLEKVVKPRYIIHCALDDIIPFNEYFIIPYLLWFLYVPAVYLFLAHCDKESCAKLAVIMFGGMTFCVLMYIVLPNGLNLRSPISDDNIFCRLIMLIRRCDTATNVCPSIHVVNTLAVTYAFIKSPASEKMRVLRVLSLVLAGAICVSTLAIDQHSVVDVVCAALLFFALRQFAYRKEEEPVFVRQNSKRHSLKYK
ncbi:MAG: serine/threonine protein phosphatase [Clostridia bacterium]|nr:serine/threonine protein phosphatase [Clostridia bacterium]